MVAEGGFASLRERAQAAARARVEAALEGLEAYHATRVSAGAARRAAAVRMPGAD